ncbi:MAG: alpha-D-ribose 1-methylphosphonate 5-triphosphate diphosphatase [Candidatus Eremiobacteraeota bacterium]|nr:alpha-D-ribose 1-methylphosphonate 5-triphosphate diphosphatase [Candidatus Eremiobacteraeota bacterium]
MIAALHAKRVFADGRILPDGWVSVDGEQIVSVTSEAPAGTMTYDLGDVDLVPGAVDLHSDCLENLAHPRPSASLPLEAALYDLDAYVTAHGVTTNYLCIGLEDDATKHRSDKRALETEALIRRVRPGLRANYAIHLRVDITRDSREIVRTFMRHGAVALISYMDHTPGQGQYPEEDDWKKHYQSRWGAGEATMEERLAAKREGQARVAEMRAMVATMGREFGAIVAAHDDDSAGAVLLARDLGVQISEFPVNAEAAMTATRHGVGVLMGAPNARRGRSHLTNLSAREALALGTLDALASDYHPPSLFAAAYALAGEDLCPLEDAIGLVTAGPARIARLEDRGRIAPGLRADLVAIERRGWHPVVRQTWVGGKPVLGVALSPLETSMAS